MCRYAAAEVGDSVAEVDVMLPWDNPDSLELQSSANR